MDTDTRVAIERLQAEVERLRQRIEHMVGRKGGHIEGQIVMDGWIQWAEQSSAPVTPAADRVRV